MMYNAFWETLDFDLPPLPAGAAWRRLVDTNLAPPDDITPLAQSLPVEGARYRVADRSVVVLAAEIEGEGSEQ
jgi:glycogen operon protein